MKVSVANYSIHSVDLISNFPYCLPYISCNVSLENLVLDQLKIPLLLFFFIVITCLLEYSIDIVRRNSVVVTHGSLRLKQGDV